MMEESWHKPLASKQVEMDLLQDFGDTFMDFEVSRSTVPDICDTVFKFNCLSENVETHFDCDDLLSVLSPSEPSDLHLGLDSSEPLRQDCMWSGLGPGEEHKSLSLPGEKEKPQTCATAPDSDSLNSVFDTPLQSDFETSDLDESFSDLDTESSPSCDTDIVSLTPQKVPDNIPDKTSVLLDHMYTDHCYISSASAPSTQIMTKKQGSDDHTNKSTKENNKITIKRKPTDTKSNIVRLYQNKTKGLSSGSAKFKFQMKFLSPSLASARGLGRSARRRRTALKNAFCPAPAITSEIKDRGGSGCNLAKETDKVKDIRDLHNSMERQRRVDLKRAFDCLKFCVPELAHSDKASKLMILDKAAIFCQTLKKKESNLHSEKERQRRRQFHLKKKLHLLECKSSSKSLLLPPNRRLTFK